MKLNSRSSQLFSSLLSPSRLRTARLVALLGTPLSSYFFAYFEFSISNISRKNSWFLFKLQLSFWILPISELRAGRAEIGKYNSFTSAHFHCLQVYRSGLEAIFSKVVRIFIFSHVDYSVFIRIHRLFQSEFDFLPFNCFSQSLSPFWLLMESVRTERAGAVLGRLPVRTL